VKGRTRVKPSEWSEQPVAGQRMSAVAYVLVDLRQGIESGMIRVGERLPSESALAARYAVSRAVIREVLRSCEAAGLTVTRPGKGTFVVADHPAEMVFDGYSAKHLMEARPGIEVPAAALAALRRTDAQLASLQRLVEEMEHEQDEAVWTRLDSQFHLAIAEASGNPVFADVLASIAAALRNQSEMLNVQVNRRRASQTEHRAIVSSIASASALEAEDAMRFHLDEVQEALATLLTSGREP
jgi:GntR family transcriptional regulator, transcriptional repressor for pyruvate dehydrogenase complex